MSFLREEPTFDSEVAQLLKDLEEIKTAQLTGGDSWIFYRNVSGLSSDLHVSIPSSGSVKVYRIEFAPEKPELTCAANLFMSEDVAPGMSWRTQVIPTQGDQHSWDVRYTANVNNFVLDARVIIKATQRGTFTIMQIA